MPGEIGTDPHVEFINILPAWIRGNLSESDQDPVLHVDQVVLDLVIKESAYVPIVILIYEAVATFH
jgi:hypothetical protein